MRTMVNIIIAILVVFPVACSEETTSKTPKTGSETHFVRDLNIAGADILVVGTLEGDDRARLYKFTDEKEFEVVELRAGRILGMDSTPTEILEMKTPPTAIFDVNDSYVLLNFSDQTWLVRKEDGRVFFIEPANILSIHRGANRRFNVQSDDAEHVYYVHEFDPSEQEANQQLRRVNVEPGFISTQTLSPDTHRVEEFAVRGDGAVVYRYEIAECHMPDNRTGPNTCGLNHSGFLLQDCIDGRWVDRKNCTDDFCVEPDNRIGPNSCGLNGSGTFFQDCIDGLWVDSVNCIENACIAPDNRTGPNTCGLNDSGFLLQDCIDGRWVDSKQCTDDFCIAPDNRTGPTACGIDGAGFLTQDCVNGRWMDSAHCTYDFQGGTLLWKNGRMQPLPGVLQFWKGSAGDVFALLSDDRVVRIIDDKDGNVAFEDYATLDGSDIEYGGTIYHYPEHTIFVPQVGTKVIELENPEKQIKSIDTGMLVLSRTATTKTHYYIAGTDVEAKANVLSIDPVANTVTPLFTPGEFQILELENFTANKVLLQTARILTLEITIAEVMGEEITELDIERFEGEILFLERIQ